MDDTNAFYWLGKRDALAEVLADNFKEIKLPSVAEQYQKLTGELHFSHKWHTGEDSA